MVVVYILLGPLVAVMCFVAFVLTGGSFGYSVLISLLIGVCAPVLIAVLKLVFTSKLSLKLVRKFQVNSES